MIKLLGVAHNTESGIEVGVYPMMIHKEHPLASVRDSFNAVLFMEMQQMMQCSMDAVQESSQQPVQLWEM